MSRYFGSWGVWEVQEKGKELESVVNKKEKDSIVLVMKVSVRVPELSHIIRVNMSKRCEQNGISKEIKQMRVVRI